MGQDDAIEQINDAIVRLRRLLPSHPNRHSCIANFTNCGC